MGKSGFIGILILLLIMGLGFYIVTTYFSQAPNTDTKQTASSIPKYPGSKEWKVDSQQKICLFDLGGCSNAPSFINFESNDAWPSIYAHYREKLLQDEWLTNSQIYTSVPTEIIFTKTLRQDTSCEAHLTKSPGRLFNKNKNPNLNTYTFTLKCLPKK